MSYIESNLMPGESIVVQGKIHWIFVASPLVALILAGLALVVCTGTVFSDLHEAIRFAAGVGGVFLVFVFFGGLRGLIDSLLTYLSGDEVAVTTQRVILKTGVIRRNHSEFTFRQIESVALDQGIVARLVGAAQVSVRGSGSGWVKTPILANHRDFRHAALERIEAASQAGPRPAPEAQRSAS